ncbi:hypothetical protein ABID70_002915 [Clavibacter michiganensis]
MPRATPRTTGARRASATWRSTRDRSRTSSASGAAAPDHGWARLYEDRHPFAGGPDHHAAFLEDGERFKVELVADS